MRPSYRYLAKPIEHPDNISVLMPTRARPGGLECVFENFNETIEYRNLVDIWLFVDDDDVLTLDYIKSGAWNKYKLNINWVIGRSTGSMGEMLNILWQKSTTNSGIFFPFVDDYQIETKNWDTILRDSFSNHEDGIQLGFLPDPNVEPHQVTLPIPSAQWLNILGYFITNRFYYWFDDNWMDEVSQMANRKMLIPVWLKVPEGKGKTPRMRNLPFWENYYHQTRVDRFNDALMLLGAIHGSDAAELEASIVSAQKVAATLVHKSNFVDLPRLQQIEANLSDPHRLLNAQQVVNYQKAELSAVEDLLDRISANSGTHYNDILTALDVLSLSTFKIPDIPYLKACTLNKLGYPFDAKNIILEELAQENPDPKMCSLEAILPDNIQQNSHADKFSSIRMPDWLGIKETDFILFPEEIDQELYFTIQRIIYDDHGITTILDIGAASGSGSTHAILSAITRKPEVLVYCIEPDKDKFKALCRPNNNARYFLGSSVSIDSYILEEELESFYTSVKTNLNHINLCDLVKTYRDEKNYLNNNNLTPCSIDYIRTANGISNFDLVVIDGSQFTGEADLNKVYGAKYIVLNYVLSIKNYTNFMKLRSDSSYKLVYGNLTLRCGYCVFKRILF
ncbi:MAG: hypothetical protein WCK54_17630 [Desulfuromonadales bacterium]